MGATRQAFAIAELPAQGQDFARLWQDWRLRQKRRRLLARAIRKRRELTAVIDRTAGLGREAILCVMVVRNEAIRLPNFLAHHRRLGVGPFPDC